MTEKSYEELDALLVQIRVRIARVRQSDPATAEELKGLVSQLELWVDSLVVDSLKLRSLESRSERATEPQKRSRKRQTGNKRPAE